MTRLVRFSLRRIAFAIGVLLLAVSGALIGVQATAGAARSSTPQSTTPTLDHFLCYVTNPVKPFTIPNVVLKNQFTKADGTTLKPKFTQSELIHCNPTAKYINGALVAPITHKNAHLLCYPITGVSTQPTHVVQVTNQFGQATLDTGQPIALCVPAWKSLVGPPGKTVNEPPGLDHFTCYPVTYDPNTTSRFNPPNPGVTLQDQFSSTPVQVTVGNPEILCLPTTKKVGTTVYPPISPAPVQDHLLCFDVTQTPFPSTIWDQNQFGTRQLHIVQTIYVCVPSQKTLIH